MCENPKVSQFGHNMHALYVASSCAKASKRGNCRGKAGENVPLDDTPLPKKEEINLNCTWLLPRDQSLNRFFI